MPAGAWIILARPLARGLLAGQRRRAAGTGVPVRERYTPAAFSPCAQKCRVRSQLRCAGVVQPFFNPGTRTTMKSLSSGSPGLRPVEPKFVSLTIAR